MGDVLLDPVFIHLKRTCQALIHQMYMNRDHIDTKPFVHTCHLSLCISVWSCENKPFIPPF